MPQPDRRPFWTDCLAPYAHPSWGAGLTDLATSVVPYLALCVLMYLLLPVSPLLTLALAIPAGGFLVRTFCVFHDCSHGSLLPSRRANAYVGALAGLLVLAPFRRWRHDHAVHHASSGDLDRRGVGDLPTLTVNEYNARPWRSRLAYRLFRNPLVMFGLGPVFAMMIGPRIATRAQRPRMRHSVLGTDLALFVVIGVAGLLMGWTNFLLVWAPAALLAGSIGIWLFYVQHQFEDAYWERGDDWTYGEAALRGSSYLKLPKVLQFFTGNIGLHHVHHLNAKIPNYNLQRAHDANPIFADVPTLTLADGLRAVRLKLWDESTQRLVGFSAARRVRLVTA
ncbi:MAG: fatty acid desaturase [Solirubrobacteraceae bacterium]